MLLLNVEDILGYAQIQNNRFVKTPKPFNIWKAVQEIIDIQIYQAKSKGIRLYSDFVNFPAKLNVQNNYGPGDSVPVRDQNHTICSEEKRIKQVLINLQSNAIKFTKEGGSVKIIVEFIRHQSKSKKK